MGVMDRYYNNRQQVETQNDTRQRIGVMDRYYLNNTTDTSVVNEDYLQTFIKEAQSFSTSFNEPNSNSNRYQEWQNLDKKVNTLNVWLRKNKNNIKEEEYNNFSKILDSFSAYEKYFSQFESENEYNDAVKVNELYNLSSEQIEKQMGVASADTQAQIDSLTAERDELKRKIIYYNRGDKSKFSSSKEKNAAQDKVNRLNEQINKLKNNESIAYTTTSGQNITWQKLYDTKKAEEEFDALYTELSSKEDWEKYVQKGANIENPDYYNAQGKFNTFGGLLRLGEEKVGNIVTFSRENYDELRYRQEGLRYDEVGDFKYMFMTDKEVEIYNYYLAKHGEEKAEEYLDSIYELLNQRYDSEYIEKMASLAEEHPVIASITSPVLTLASGTEYIFDTAESLIKGKGIDTNVHATAKNTIHSTVSEKVDWEIGDWDAFDFIYGTGMSTVDSAVSMALLGNFGGVALGLSAAADSTNDALNRGMSKGQAFVSGLASGIFEGVFESWQIGAFSDLTKNLTKADFVNLAKYIGKNMWNNAKEETLTEIANIAYDTLVNGDFSQYETAIRQYMNSGMSEHDAKLKVALKLGTQVAESGASGALMGFGFGTAGSVATKVKQSKINSQNLKLYGNDVAALVAQGLSAPEGSKSRMLAEQLQAKLDNGQQLTGADITAMITANEKQFTADDTAKIIRAVQSRLTELGETSNIDVLSSAITKRITGQELTDTEQKVISESKYGQRVLNEASPENIKAGAYSSSWVNDIGTRRINADVYNTSTETDGIDGEVVDNTVQNGYNNVGNGIVNGVNTNQGNISEEQRELYTAAILRYKSSESYKINAKLRDNELLSETEQEFVDTLDAALQSLPTYEGTVYRNLVFDDSGGVEVYNDFVKQHVVGKPIFYNQFVSCSKTEDGYTVDGEYKVQLIVEGKQARDVDGYGNNMENEVIFTRNSVFIVTRVDVVGQNATIYLKEDVDDGYYTVEEPRTTVRDVQKSHIGNGNLQSVSKEDSNRYSRGAFRPQSTASGGQRNTVRTGGQRGTVLSTESGEQKVNTTNGEADLDDESAFFMDENGASQSGTKGITEPDISKDTRSHEERVAEMMGGKESQKVKGRKFVQSIGKALGVTVVFEDTVEKYGEWSDGYIDKNGVIHIDYNNKNPLAFLFRHEMVHYGSGSKFYKQFVKLVYNSKLFREWLQEKTKMPAGTSVDRMAAKYMTMVAESRKGVEELSETRLQEEMVADFAGSDLFTAGGSGLAAMSTEFDTKQRNVVSQYIADVISWIKKKINKVPGAENLTFELSRLEDTFNRMISDAKQNPTERELKHSKPINQRIDKYGFMQDNNSRANKQGDLVNEFYNALSKKEWTTFYNEITKEGYLATATVGTVAPIVVNDKLIIAERLHRGIDAHDYVVIDAFRLQESYDVDTLELIKRKIEEGDLSYDKRTIHRTLSKLLERTFSSGILTRFDGDSQQYVVSSTEGANSANNYNFHGDSQEGITREGLSLRNKPGVQGNNGLLDNKSKAELNDSAFSIPENIRRSVPVGIPKQLAIVTQNFNVAMRDGETRELFQKAKNGDEKSAILLAEKKITDEILSEITANFGDCFLVSVTSVQGLSDNILPSSLAKFIGTKNKLSVITGIYKTSKNEMKAKDVTERLREKITFDIYDNEVYNTIKGKDILIIDDVITTSHTTNSLAKFLTDNGANVRGVFALFKGKDSVKTDVMNLAITPEELELLNENDERVRPYVPEGTEYRALTTRMAKAIIRKSGIGSAKSEGKGDFGRSGETNKQGHERNGNIGIKAELNDSAFSMPENIRRSVPVDFDADVKNNFEEGIVNYTETQYNNFGWVSYNDIVTAKEREILFSRYADYKHNKNKYPTTRFGEAVIHSTECPDVIMYIKGQIGSPQVTKVVRINIDDYNASVIKELILLNEYRQISLPYSSTEDMYGQEVLSISYKRDCASFQEYRAQQKGKNSESGDTTGGTEQNRGRGTKQNTGNDRAELGDSAFSMPKNIRRSIPVDTNTDADVDTDNDIIADFQKLNNEFNKGNIEEEAYMQRVAELYEEIVKKNGRIKPGEVGKTKYQDIPVPKRIDKKTKVQRHVRTVLEGGELTDEMVGTVKADILSGEFNYKPTSNKKNIAYAEDAIMKGAAVGIWEKAINGDGLPTATDIAVGEALLKLAVERGNAAEVVKYTAELAELGTRLGQSVQALSTLKRMDGVGQLLYVKRAVDSLNRDLSKRFKGNAPVIQIDENMAMRLAESKTAEDFEITYSAIMNDIAAQVPTTFLDKWNAWRYMAMLFNPTTHIRNITGNAIFIPGITIKNTLSALGEKAFIKTENRTKSIKLKKEYANFGDNDFENVVNALTGSGKMNPKTSIAQDKPIFKTKWLENLRKFNFDLLEKEDMIFLRKHYKNALGGYLQAQKVDLNNIPSEVLARAREYAVIEAQKATYRDANSIATAIQQFSNKNTISNILIEGVLPFKKTPMNIVKRGIEYSPIGIIKTLTKGVYDLKAGNITASQFIDSLAGGLTGTGIVLLGSLLSSLGVAVGGFDDEDEDWFRKLNGEQEYAIRIGDTSYTIDWAAPVCIPFFIGVAINEMASSESNENLLANAGELALAGLEPIINLSMLSGIQDTIAAARYADADEIIYRVAGNVVGSYFSQAVPTIGGKMANVGDDTRRSNYIDKTSNVPVWLQSALNTVKSKTPFLSQSRPEYINAWGEIQGNGNFIKRFFQQFLSPGYVSTVNENDISREISRLAKGTGEAKVIPDNAPRYFKFKNTTRHLTAEEYKEYATVRGQKSADYIAEAISNSGYEELTDSQKVQVISDIYSYCNAYAKTTLEYSYDEVNAMYDGKITNAKYSSLGVSGKKDLVTEYFLDKFSKPHTIERNGGSIVKYFIEKQKKENKSNN